MFENQKKKRKYGHKRYFCINPYLKDRLDIEFTACYIELIGSRLPEKKRGHYLGLPYLTHIGSLLV